MAFKTKNNLSEEEKELVMVDKLKNNKDVE